jgi:two-component system response regulator NreC
MGKLQIFLVDDHAMVREGLKSLVNEQPDMQVVGEANNGKCAVEKLKACHADIVVMDISMPKLNGAKATELLILECPEVKVLALTAYEDRSYLRRLLQAGASGFLLKRAAAAELINALRTIAAGGVYIDPTMMGTVVNDLARQPFSKETSRQHSLSEREAEVLRLIAWGHSNKEISAQLEISVKTVETYKARLMEKLDLHSRTDIVRYALQQGWLQDT